jgi:hypothetical protein
VEEVRSAEHVAGGQLGPGLDGQTHQAPPRLEHDRVAPGRASEDLGHAPGEDVQVLRLATSSIYANRFSLQTKLTFKTAESTTLHGCNASALLLYLTQSGF